MDDRRSIMDGHYRAFGAILVGGSSRRMGCPKQLVELGNETMVERVFAALSAHVDEVLLLGGGLVPPSLGRLRRVQDAPECSGPLAGLIGGLRAMPGVGMVVVPCDLPLIEPRAVEWLIAERGDAAAVIPVVDDRIEPLFAIYETSVLPHLEATAERGDFALRSVVVSEWVRRVSPPSTIRHCWFNANTPHDLLGLSVGHGEGR